MARLPRQLEGLARMLTYILCHRPDEFGLVLAEDGFISLKQLHQALAAEPGWGFVRRRHLEEVATLLQPPRFEIVGEQIRGLAPGPARLRRPPGEKPPPLLYLALSPKAQARVWEEGLKPPSGQELVLARQADLARKIGGRRAAEPILITVQAQAAFKAGINLQGYGEELFLAPALPREFLQMPPPPPGQEKAKPVRGPEPPTPGGALPLDFSKVLKPVPKTRRHQAEPAWKSQTRTWRKKRRRGE